MTRPVMLVVLDGFGIGDRGASDATALAYTPFFDQITQNYPHAALETSGEAVGLPPGQMGNSEVGHMTMGAGRVIDQDLTRISKALAAGELERLPAIRSLCDALRRSGGKLHLIGLVSDGGVHSHQQHLDALLETFGRLGFAPVVHAFLDGRDTPPQSALGYLEALAPRVAAVNGKIATVCGRFYAMDRDQRWDRVAAAYHALVLGEGERAADALAAVRAAYARGETDEFVKPTIIDAAPRIEDGDAILCFNFRADRAREITNALSGVLPQQFAGALVRRKTVALAAYCCLTEYDAEFGLPVVFENQRAENILGDLIAREGLRQLRIAETEKYAHVTFFFNNGLETPFPGEKRILVPSPREVTTYDQKPEMSANLVTQELLQAIAREDYAFILVNFANPDMVGHTGNLPAAIEAVETIDQCLAQVTQAFLAKNGTLLITADHGNCELMVDPETGAPHTAHTTNPVPLWWIASDTKGRNLHSGSLADLAPTILHLLGLKVPREMTGQNLIA